MFEYAVKSISRMIIRYDVVYYCSLIATYIQYVFRKMFYIKTDIWQRCEYYSCLIYN